MKKTLCSILLFFCVFCNAATRQAEKAEVSNEPNIDQVVVTGEDGKRELVLTREEYMSLYRLASRYIALKDKISNATVKDNIEVTQINDDIYEVKMKLNEDIILTAVVEINNEELNELRAKMKRITTAEPTVEHKKVGHNRYKVTMIIDDVSWSAEFNIEAEQGFSYESFGAGGLLGLVLGLLLAPKTGGASLLLL